MVHFLTHPEQYAEDIKVPLFTLYQQYVSAQRSEPHLEGSRSTLGVNNPEGLRQEIWIRPDSGATNCRTLSSSNNEDDDDRDEELKKMSTDQVCVFLCFEVSVSFLIGRGHTNFKKTTNV